MQDVVYGTLSIKLRRQLHAHIASWLSAKATGDRGAALLASHYDRADDRKRAAATYVRAAQFASFLGQSPEALRHLERADELHTDSAQGNSPAFKYSGEPETDNRMASWRQRVGLRIDLGDVLRSLGKLDEAEGMYERARVILPREERRRKGELDQAERTGLEARIDYRLALTHKLRGPTERAKSLIERAIQKAEEANVAQDAPAMWSLRAALHRRAGDLDACKEAALEGLRRCRRIEVRDAAWSQAVSELLVSLGAVFYSRKQMVRAERCYR